MITIIKKSNSTTIIKINNYTITSNKNNCQNNVIYKMYTNNSVLYIIQSDSYYNK